MSLEHTTLEIQIKAKKVIRYVQVCKYAEIEQATVQRDCFLNQKWVPFEEWLNLNKQIKELEADKVVMQKGINEYRVRSEVLGSRVLELSAKIAEANKILDEHRTIGTPCHIMTERLREALK